MEYLIGTGGWAYLPIKGKSRLKSYSEIFNFVEVNYTFYDYPDLHRVQIWRKMVPEDFTFSVRCHQDLTHRIGLRSIDEAFQVLGQMITYCRILESPFLVLETPKSYEFNENSIKEAGDFFNSSNLKDLRLVWESRSPVTAEAVALMQDMNIVHAVDISKQTPLFSSDILYTRLFGKGKHNIYQFSDAELEEIGHKILTSKAERAVLSYHGARMYSDALRFASFKRSGLFPPVTPFVGVESAKSVLSEDAHFPISKKSLIEDQGWKVFDVDENERIHLSDWLREIPDKIYANVDEVIQELEANH